MRPTVSFGPLFLALLASPSVLLAQSAAKSVVLRVDPEHGSDKGKGDPRHPLATLGAALARIPDPLDDDVTIEIAPGTLSNRGDARGDGPLLLGRRMRPDVRVRIVGLDPERQPVFAWRGDEMLRVSEGNWEIAQVQIGEFEKFQRRGVMASGPCDVHLRDVRFRLRSLSDAAVWSTRGALVSLRGRIAINDHLHEKADDESFSGLIATDHGIIEFAQKEGATLDMGNGSLSVRGYGMIRLGCESARITCWTQSNILAVNNGGRIDVRNTPLVLHACQHQNTPIGLEHDGHVLAEDAKITIVGTNDSAIALQKASTFTCNHIQLDGNFEYAIWASSGSMFVGRFLGDVTKVRASTGAGIHIERIGGELRGPVEALSGGLVSLPDRVVRSD